MNIPRTHSTPEVSRSRGDLSYTKNKVSIGINTSPPMSMASTSHGSGRIILDCVLVPSRQSSFSVCPAQLTSEASSRPDGAENAISTPAQPPQKRKRGRPRKIVPAQSPSEDEAICSKTMLPTPDVSTQSTLATDEEALDPSRGGEASREY
ncbi:hypothetical protein BC629DRAFT_854267 [Irpex lacteus]|nr:hypothetical protein BC629DRAFT_854267 [Irpex lacteus]